MLTDPRCHDVAMTGEITLRGGCLPWGIKEKVPATHRGNRRLFAPERCKADLEDPRNQRRLEFVFVQRMIGVLEKCLRRYPPT